MKTLEITLGQMEVAGRWDIDFHLPALEVRKYDQNILRRVDSVANVSKLKRDPTKRAESEFKYIDISCVDVVTGSIQTPQDLIGLEAPSRARKVVQGYDIIISTCRPTRGAIAIVPVAYHNQIASTGFSVISPKQNVNPLYLHYALRLSSTMEQFRKWSTGSSYPAILDEDVKKTLIPVPTIDIQDKIAKYLMEESKKRNGLILQANTIWKDALKNIDKELKRDITENPASLEQGSALETKSPIPPCETEQIHKIISQLPKVDSDSKTNDDDEMELFE